ncbi:MAG: M1 family metallopeptidase [Myxococcota bacterium]
MNLHGLRPALVAALLVAAGCPGRSGTTGAANIAPRAGDAPRAEVVDEAEPPAGRLPQDVRPRSYRLAMRIAPGQDRFGGEAEIRVALDAPRSVLWMHGRGLDVTSAVVETEDGRRLDATWDPVPAEKADGVAALRLPEPLPPGEATLLLAWTAPFSDALDGLYHVREGGEAYAFTQFEATYARQAFPCFDEPVFKTPFDVTLEVPADDRALGNTPAVETTPANDGMKRVRLATTKPIPTYLVAWAVGPLDVVEAEPIAPNDVRDRPVPLRGVAVRGEGDGLARALAGTPALLAALERYLGAPYPYEKLDIVAVPDFASGAMENVGLVTFRDSLLLMGDDPPEWQKRAFANVMAHELAHQWFGNLVTMPWWDDLWLNEAFATWLAPRVVAEVHPEHQPLLGLLEDVQHAMRADSLATARRIREPIDTSHDIRNAFDAITYEKGAAVLWMFEHWLGEATFRRGLQQYLRAHAFGTATTGDLLAALSAAAERDVAGPMRSFLDQVGVPLVEVGVSCTDEGTKLALRQQRYLPVGSRAEADVAWQVPVCMHLGRGEGRVDQYCFLLREREQEVLLEGERCAEWVMPNADGAGYYRFALGESALSDLRRRGWAALSAREKLAVSGSVRAAFAAAELAVPDVFGALETFARSDVRPVAELPTGLVDFAHEHLVDEAKRPSVARFGRRLYAPVWRRLGWSPKPDEAGEARLLRATVLRFLALGVKDPAVRRQAVRRAHRYLGWDGNKVIDRGAVPVDLVPTVLAVAVQEGDAALFDHMVDTLAQISDPVLRGRLLTAVGHATDPELAARARALALDRRLRVNEVTTPLRVQLAQPETREAAWRWLTENYDALADRMATTRAGALPWLASGFCSPEDAQRVERFFEPRISELPGGPRNLAGALEAIRLCTARVEAHRDAAHRFF